MTSMVMMMMVMPRAAAWAPPSPDHASIWR